MAAKEQKTNTQMSKAEVHPRALWDGTEANDWALGPSFFFSQHN